MPAALFDTNAVSDLMRDDPKVLAHMASHADPVLTSVVAAGEIRFGLQRLPLGKKRRHLEARAKGVLGCCPSNRSLNQSPTHTVLLRRLWKARALPPRTMTCGSLPRL
jgi:hypothetical protein